MSLLTNCYAKSIELKELFELNYHRVKIFNSTENLLFTYHPQLNKLSIFYFVDFLRYSLLLIIIIAC